MASGRKFRFFGAFKSKTKAKRAEKKHRGSFILSRIIEHHRRFVVLKKKGN